MKRFTVEERKLSVYEYQLMRRSTGWYLIEDEVVKKALKNDLYSVAISDEDKLVGIGRVVGDGALYFYVQDVIVLPDYKGKGIGRLIMEAIENFIKHEARHNAFIGLMAASGVTNFYRQFDYEPRPESGPGMYKVIKLKKE